MKLFFLLLTILFSSFLIFAQQTETPQPVEWKAFTPENEEFSIETPISLYASKFKIATSLRPTPEEESEDSRRFLNSLNGTYFYIFSDDWRKPIQFRNVLRFANAQNQLEATQNSGDILTKKFEFADETGFYHTILSVSGKNRVYVFQTVSPTKENPLVERFFGSLKFNGKLLTETISKSKTEKSVTVTVQTPENESVVVLPKVTTGGLGTKTQPTPENKSSNTTPNNETVGVRILSKPRADYTDFARFYEMTGKVVLRVVFSANGKIGAIKPATKLPFGLTETAIEAARGISFEPATRGGIPYSVWKPVEYTFTIY